MMENNKILLAFKDDDDITAFSSYLSGIGFDLTAAKDGARALESAIQDVPSIVMADLDLPVISGAKLFQILRNNPHTSRVPFLFISNSIADIKGFRAGVDIFLLRPINLEEMHGRVKQTLSIKGGGPIGSKDIEGKLTHMSLADILQFLHLNKKEGELKVVCGEMNGSVFIKDGQIYNAAADGVEKEKALFRLLQCSDGKFEFIPKAVNITKKIRSTTGNLIMEGMRQIDEFKKKHGQLPDKKSLVSSRVEAGSLPKGLNPIIYEIVHLTKHYQKVGDIVEHCSFPDYEVYNQISSMLGKGILEDQTAKGAEHGRPDEFLTHDQAISIREKIISRFTDMYNLNYGKIFVISTSGAVASSFVSQCRHIPGFSVNTKSALSHISMDNPLGDVAGLKLYGGMELALFSIPTVRNMAPLWRAFSSNLVGLILLWDLEGAREIKELMAAKKEILARRRVPAVHIFHGDKAACEEEFYKKAFNLKMDEPLFKMDSPDGAMIFEVFYSLFGNLLKDDYVSS